jgi:hypothetical protein
MSHRHVRIAAAFAGLSLLCAGMNAVRADATPDKVEPAATVERHPTVCNERYLPVCGRIGDVEKIYSNACVARANGAMVIGEGSCTGGHVEPVPKQ